MNKKFVPSGPRMGFKEAGKLGGAATKIRCLLIKKEEELQYSKEPKLCKYCKGPVSFKKRKNLYCSGKCRAIQTNMQRGASSKISTPCPVCRKGILHSSRIKNPKKFCSKRCSFDYKIQKTLKRFNSGLIQDRGVIRIVLLRLKNSCWCCGLSTWRDAPLPLEVDHKDGDASNNKPENVWLVCPNCHSVTPTWKGRNRGKGRKSRGLKLT